LILEKKKRSIVDSKNQILATIAGCFENIISIAILKSETDTHKYQNIAFFFSSLFTSDFGLNSISRIFIIIYHNMKYNTASHINA